MASFFGEVRPLSSRAVDDEEADNQPKYNVVFDKSENLAPSDIKLIIFSVGEIASIFAKSYFLKDNSSCFSSIKYSCVKPADDEASTLYTGMQSRRNLKDLTAVSLFSSIPGVLVCEIFKSVPDEICYEIAEIIFKNYSPSNVLILASNHVAAFKSANSVAFEMPFLKSLSTSQHVAAYRCNIPHLVPPNFLSNMPATLLLKCEVTKIPALCVVNYVDTDTVDSLNVKVFEDVLKESIVTQTAVNPNAESRVISYVKAKQSVQSNLYI